MVIPEGIRLKPLGKLGEKFNARELADDLDELEDSMIRKYAFESEGYERYAHVYTPGDVIPNMFLNFRMIWDIEDGKMLYSNTGIATLANIQTKVEVGDNEFETKNSSMRSHDRSFDIDWNDNLTLGQVLRMIVDNEKQGDYWVMACRGGDIVEKAQACGEEMIKVGLNISTTPIFKSIRDKIDDIERYYSNEKPFTSSYESIQNDPELIRLFIATFIIYARNETDGNNFTISTNLLCTINQIHSTKNISNIAVNWVAKKAPLFNEWFNRVKRKLAAPKKKPKSKGFSFKF